MIKGSGNIPPRYLRGRRNTDRTSAILSPLPSLNLLGETNDYSMNIGNEGIMCSLEEMTELKTIVLKNVLA